jgi:diguanylate cyclase (GGDEF)-like protein
MTAETVATGDKPGRHPLAGVRAWKLWQLPRSARVLIFVVELATVGATAAAVGTTRWDAGAFGRLSILLFLGMAFSEVTHQMHRMRRFLGGATFVELNSVWTFAGVLLLPVSYTVALVTGLFVFAGIRRRQQRATPYRLLYSGAVLVLTAIAAESVATQIRPQLQELPSGPLTAVAICAAMAIFFATNLGLVVAAIYLAVGRVPVRQLLPGRDELGLELATLVLGISTAEMLLYLPWLTPLVLILMLLLQLSSLVSQLQVAATTDAKTGLLNATAWQELAQRELLRARRDEAPCAVLLLDLDHFKRVNDTLGHLAGDAALKAVADALKKELRGYDAVARFGGEEFVVLLNDLLPGQARLVAERTLSRIREVVITGHNTDGPRFPLTASIGLAIYPEHGSELTDLLESADAALYRAKRQGRDRVSEPVWDVPENAQL